MTSYSLQRIIIPEDWLPFTLWFHQTIHQKILHEVELIETEIFAFQFRYQCTVEETKNIPQEEEEETQVQSKNSAAHDMFRALARILHPDRACDAEDALRRTELLAQANQAVESGDILFLQQLLHTHTHQERTTREKIMMLKYQIHTLYGKKHSLLQSSTWELYQLELQWAEQGRDLLSYLAERVS